MHKMCNTRGCFVTNIYKTKLVVCLWLWDVRHTIWKSCDFRFDACGWSSDRSCPKLSVGRTCIRYVRSTLGISLIALWGTIAKVCRSPVKRTNFVWEVGVFEKIALKASKSVGLRVEAWNAYFCSFRGRGGGVQGKRILCFAGLLWTAALTPNKKPVHANLLSRWWMHNDESVTSLMRPPVMSKSNLRIWEAQWLVLLDHSSCRSPACAYEKHHVQ